MKRLLCIAMIAMLVGCKTSDSLNFGERYLVKNYEQKRRKKIKKYHDDKLKMLKGVKTPK